MHPSPPASITTGAISGMHEKVVNIDAPELSGQADRLVRRQRLVAKEHHAAIGKSPPDGRKNGLGPRFGQVGTGDCGTHHPARPDRFRSNSFAYRPLPTNLTTNGQFLKLTCRLPAFRASEVE
jgi:hypothetical protein